jgi:hypothetical protein
LGCTTGSAQRREKGLILKCYANEIAVSPDHAALPDVMKIIECHFKFQRQDVKILQSNSRAAICNVVHPASEYTDPGVEVEQCALRDRRSSD